MSKNLIIFFLLLSLSACGVEKENEIKNEKDVGFDNVDKVVQKKESKKSNNLNMNQSVHNNEKKNMQKIDNTKFEDLVSKYSKAIIKTNQGDITVEFYGKDSPKTVNNFLNLAKLNFYDNTRFHRVMKDFMIQAGDPLSADKSMKARWGTGGPDYRFEDEINEKKLVKGSFAMANAGPNTNGSQFFIVTVEATPWLDGKHTNFGEVVSGMDVVEKIENTKVSGTMPIEDMIILDVELVN